MNETENKSAGTEREAEVAEPDPHGIDADDNPSNGPNLILIYSLIALALAAAIGFAAMIVLPFYHRR
jgi:hypothetical protein